MKLKNRILGGMAVIAMFTTSSVYAAPAKTTSSGMFASVAYMPTLQGEQKFTGSKDVNGTPTDITETSLKEGTYMSWMGFGATVGYAMGDIELSFDMDYRGSKYQTEKDDDKTDNFEAESINFKEHSKIFAGLSAAYNLSLTKEIVASVGAGAGLEWNTLTVSELGGTEDFDYKATPFALQGKVAVGYDMGAMTPYAGYKLRYTFEKEYEADDKALVDTTATKITYQSSIAHLFDLGVKFSF